MRLAAFVVAAVLAAVAGSSRADEPTTEELVKEWFARSKEAAALLDGIKDKAAAEKAKPKLEALSKQILEGMKAIGKRPEPEVEGAIQARMEKLASVADAYERLAGRSSPAAEVLDDVSLIRQDVEAKAKINAITLMKAVQTYYVNNDRWPAKLADVADFLEAGVKATIDPWGQPYKYEIGTATDAAGMPFERAFVWCERKVGDQVKVFGMKPPAKKQ